MATSQETIDYILDQAMEAGELKYRKMFGEYALYLDEKVVALVCDDTLFVKITEAGKEFVGEEYQEGAPYPGAKPWMRISEDVLEDRPRISELFRVTADALPKPKPKKPKAKKVSKK